MVNPKFRLQYLSEFRASLMGLATIMIIACHASASNVSMPKIFHHILSLGNFGVDIFLFLSGLGCYYSLDKNSPDKYIPPPGGNECNQQPHRFYPRKGISFIQRRIKRIGIPYLMIFVPYVFILFLLGKYSIMECALSLSALEYWVYHRGAWFVSLIIPVYVITPFLYRLFIRPDKWIIVTIIIFSLIILSSLPVENHEKTNVLNNVQIALSRLPSFILGFSVAKDCKSNKKISLYALLLLAIAHIVLNRIWPHVFLKWLSVPFVLSVLSWFCSWLSNSERIYRLVKYLGIISLESYLLNITLNSLFRIIIPEYVNSLIFYGRYLEYFLVIVLGLGGAVLVHSIANRFTLIKKS